MTHPHPLKMTRPLYETQADLENERVVAALIEQKTFSKCVKLPKQYGADWAIVRNDEIVAFAELKTRKHAFGKWPTFMISLAKWMKGKELAAMVNVPFVIYVQFADGVYYAKQSCCEVTFGIGGRTDRGDAQDIEPVVHIKINALKVL